MDQAEYRDAIAEITKLAEEYFFHTSLRQIAPRKSDEELIEFWRMPDPDDGISMPEVCDELRNGFLDGLTGIINPKFLGYILTRPVAESHAFDLLANATHASPGVAHLTASGILLERCVLRWLANRMGIPTFSGMFTTGGCESTLIALKCARDQYVSRLEGITTPIVMYASRNSHYSCKRAWDILGGGESGVREFDVDSLDELRSRIQDDRESGRLPVAIMGTLGTTNTGEIEPLDRLSEIAAEERLWLHIDGAYGGGVLMLEEFAWLHEAVNRADSFSFDPHKWLGMPMGTGTVFLNAKHSFQKSFSFSAVFTDHQTFTSVIPDQCQMSIQGTRQLPGLRVWGAIRLLGFAEIKRRIRRTIALAQFLVKLLERHPNFQVLAHGQLSVVVFTVKGFDYEALLRLLKELAVNDEAFLTLTQVNDVWGIRATIISADTTEADLEFIVERIVNRVSAEAIEKFYSPRLHRPEMHRDIFGADEYIGQLDFWTKSEIEELGAKLKLSARSHLLDIGSGYGGPACFLASVFGCRVTGVDASSTNYEVALATAAARKLTGQVSFIHADVLELSFADDTFDAVIALDSVVHIKDKQVLFELCQKWLKPNGTMLIAVEAVDAGIPDQLKAMRESAGAVFCETADGYREIFLQAGLTVSEEKQYPGKRLEFSSQALRWMDANGQSAGRESMELINRLGKLGLAEEVVFLVQKPPAKPKPHEENT